MTKTRSVIQKTLCVFFLCVLCDSVVRSPAYAQREYGFDNTKPSGQPYLKPEESLRRMKVADGFEIHLAAAEPTIINPIAFTVDEKGRLWVVECFEYPSRTPKGKMPRDRIVILESTKGDGVFDKRTVFAEGKDFPMSFDLASGIEVGHGGVFLGAPPYLWFIENKNDKPGKFEVLLKGFGSQDTHEMLNTFQWGPDGWLYGLHGVFTNSEVSEPRGLSPRSEKEKDRGDKPLGSPVKINAGVWRYHPKTKKFEVFAEGTSNPWGMDWRNTDGEFILCCCVIPHLYHIVPGGIYKRQAGTSFNPYAYGEIKEICDHTFHKESGWAHAGLISLDAPHIPEKYRNSVIFGSIHGCSVKQNILKRNGSTFTASRGDDFLVSGDKNFRPINMRWGPSGEIYLIDWHDQNPCHQAKPDAWDYEHGRIFRIQVKGTEIKKAEDFGKRELTSLIQLAGSANPYIARTAIRLIGERAAKLEGHHWDDLSIIASEGVVAGNVTAFAGMWGQLTKRRANESAIVEDLQNMAKGQGKSAEPGWPKGWFYDLSPTGRQWTIRQLAESAVTEKLMAEMANLASVERDPTVRRELASAAIRLAARQDASTLICALLMHRLDANDRVIPHLLWIAFEANYTRTGRTLLKWLSDNAAGNALITDQIIPRIMRRLIATGKPADMYSCLVFVSLTFDSNARRKALEGLAEAMKGRIFDAPPGWPYQFAQLSADADSEIRKLARQLAIAFRDPEAVKQALAIAADSAKAMAERIESIRALAVLRPAEGSRLLLGLVNGGDSGLQVEAVRALAGYDEPAVAKDLLANWAKYPAAVRAEAANVLAARKDSARDLLEAVGAKKVARQDLTDNTIVRIRSFNDAKLNKRIEEVWGKFRATPKELDALINKMRASLYDGPASFVHGKAVFEQHCVKCHKFEGRGAEVGPPLDGAARDIEYLLANVLDPNRVIGQPYFVHVIERKNGTNEIGILAAEDAQTVTLKVENALLKVIAKKDIETHTVQEKSMMPEGLAANMSVPDFRDLLRYVMANPFVNHVALDGKPLTVGTPGRIPLLGAAKIVAEVTSPGAMKTRLQLGGSAELVVKLNGREVYKGRPGEEQPDQAGVEVQLTAGVNRLEIDAKSKGKAAVWARFLDPDRKLVYPEPK